VLANGNKVLTTTGSQTIKAWAQGFLWQNGGNTLGTIDLSSQTPARPSSLINSDGTYFEQTRPLFLGLQQIDVTTLGLKGDGVTDNTAALQNALNAHVGSVLFFPYGTYLIGNTVTVPPGSRLLGQVCKKEHTHLWEKIIRIFKLHQTTIIS
jgi:glucan 1,3-beta-glucosidase